MSTDPAGYLPLHLGVHELILTGTETNPTWSPPGTMGGVLALVEDLTALATTPYADIAVYDPFATGEPLELLYSDLTDILTDFLAVNGTDEYTACLGVCATLIDTLFDTTAINAAVDAFEAKQETSLLGNIGAYNVVLSDLDAVNSSARTLGIAAMITAHNQNVAVHRSELETRAYFQLLEMKVKATSDAAQILLQHKQFAVSMAQMRVSAAQLHVEAARLKYNDDLQNLLGDTFWDIKAYDFAYQALGSISGSAVIPAQPSAFSTFAASVSALSPLIIAGYKAFF